MGIDIAPPREPGEQGPNGSMQALLHINGRVTKVRPGHESRSFGVLDAVIGDGPGMRCVTAETA